MDVDRGVEVGEREPGVAAPSRESTDVAREGRAAGAPVARDGRVGATTPARVLAMQRLAGNRAAAAALRAASPKAAVQREAPPEGQLEVDGSQVASEVNEMADAAKKQGFAGAPAAPGDGAPSAGADGAASGGGAGSGAGAGDGSVAPTKSIGDTIKGATKAIDADKTAPTKSIGDTVKGATNKAFGPVGKATPPQKAGAKKAPPLPPAAKQAPVVAPAKAVPAPKKSALHITPTPVMPTKMLRPVAPPLVAPAPATEAEKSAAPVQSLPLQRDHGAPAGQGASPGFTGDMQEPVWGSWTLDELFSAGRTVLEVSRFIPGWGMLGGFAADAMGAVQDLESIPPGEYPITEGLVYVRSIANAMNNATGHLLYVGQLIQDGLTGSVIGAEFVPVSAAAIEATAAVKVALDGVVFYADLGVEIGALWNQQHCSPDQWQAWQGVIDGYQANLAGDIVGTVLDVITLSSAGATNVDTLKAGTGIFNTAGLLAQGWSDTLVTFVQGMFNVWGTKHPLIGGEQIPLGTRPPPAQGDGQGGAAATAPAPAPVQRLDAGGAAQAVAFETAAGWLNLQASQGRAAWGAVDGGIGILQEEAAKRLAELDAIVGQFSGGKTTFEVIRDAVVSGLGHMREKVGGLQELLDSATNAQSHGDRIKSEAQDILAKIDAFNVPAVQIPDVDIGEGMIANAADWFVDQAAGAANAALELAVAQVREAVDTAKQELRSPVEELEAKAEEIGEFFAMVARVSGEQIGSINGYISNFETSLAQTTGFEGAIDVIITQISRLMGGPDFRIQDLRDFWNGLPQYFDQLDGLAGRLRVAAAAIQQETPVQTLPEVMAGAAPQPGDDDEGSGDRAKL